MIVETPSILWNCEDFSKGTPAALTSIDLCESGIILDNNEHNRRRSSYVLATASSSNILNLWRLIFAEVPTSQSAISSASLPTTAPGTTSSSISTTKIEHLCSLSRHEGPINIIRFSPDGLQLVSGGENGTIIIWSVPLNQRLNNNGRHYWTTVSNENDLIYKVTPRCCTDGICDLSWSIDSKRILLGTIDHAIICLEDESYDYNHGLSNNASNTSASSNKTTASAEAGNNLPMTQQQQQQQIQSEWKVVYRNSTEHTHYVQGVSYDPLGVYLATMSCDRTVRILQRRPRRNTKKVGGNSIMDNEIIQEQLTTNRFEMISNKARQIKFRKSSTDGLASSSSSKQHLYNDESTLESFVRRLSWTIDGAFLITPAALWHKNSTIDTIDPVETVADPKSKQQQQQQQQPPVVHYATLMFARHRYDEPYRVLGGLDKVRSF
jgi:WD40 repeat protein